jgi:nitric-oxide synthase, brain
VFALGSSAYPNFCSFGKFLDNILGELGGERLMKIVLGDDLCGQEQEFRKWACEVFKTSCDVFCLDLNDMSEASMSLKSETLTKENTRFQAVKDFHIPLSALLSKYHNKKVQACKVKNKPINLHGGASTERSTVLVEIIIDSVSLSSLLVCVHPQAETGWKIVVKCLKNSGGS